ncbi:MAG: hypothetical protein A2X86_06135 [Bdellovibrionales bacterium GWA2_49_15]|nr:MAG: hypothetical protein A2X86_06135 [Bdellovibrionales bacterium GWA2_49_15]HAZ14641.1 hypothetical protein [Bdellovibrionales bacterium]
MTVNLPIFKFFYKNPKILYANKNKSNDAVSAVTLGTLLNMHVLWAQRSKQGRPVLIFYEMAGRQLN